MSWHYHTCCVNSTAELIHAMTDAAEEVTYETFRRNVGGEALDAFAKDMKYDTGNERGGLRLKNDWHVSYHKSTYDGVPCYFLDHSRIEHIWVEAAA